MFDKRGREGSAPKKNIPVKGGLVQGEFERTRRRDGRGRAPKRTRCDRGSGTTTAGKKDKTNLRGKNFGGSAGEGEKG